ncbi:Hypothetical protein AJF4211_001050 [Avibacterium paragallinarum JF4211]|nr:Hypothetical protein AJF4211_001050 [Avibacterium paragallinarum JF4211]
MSLGLRDLIFVSVSILRQFHRHYIDGIFYHFIGIGNAMPSKIPTKK